MAEGFDLNKLREQAAAKSSEEAVNEFKEKVGAPHLLTAAGFEALSPEEKKRIAEENDTTPEAFAAKLKLRELLRGESL